MYILRNSIKNLFRNKGRNIIIAIIIFLMLTFTAVSVIINSTTDKIIKKYKEQFGSEIYLQYDEEKIRENEKATGWADIPEITDEVKLKLANSEYLRETQIHVLYQAYAKELKGINQGKNNDFPSMEGYYEPNVAINGYNTPDLLKDFKEGKRKIINGQMFTIDNECIVSEDFAKLNGLKVGDEIEISDLDKKAMFPPLKLKIAGIYFDSTENKYGYVSTVTNPRNEILTTYNTMKNYQDNIAKTKLYTVDATYYLKNPDMLESFNKEAHEKGLHENYMMSTDAVSYNRIVKPTESLANTSNLFLITVLIIGSIVLLLLSVLSIRERKYEIGVLRAMGMKKWNVVRGLLYESIIITLVCLVLGLSVGSLSAPMVSNSIINNNFQESQNNFNEAKVEPEKIEVHLTVDAVIEVSLIALAIAIISSIIGVMYILRYEPMKILTERN